MAESTSRASLREQQFALSRHLRDPATGPAPAGIEDRRLAIYRDLLYNNLQSLLAGNFPVIRRTLPDGDWHALVRAFYAGHRCRTPLFTEIGREFVRWLEARIDADPGLPPWQAELAHYEWVELALQISDAEAGPVDPLEGDPRRGVALLEGVPVVSPQAWALAYRWPVHRIGPGHLPQTAPEAPTLLLVRRDGGGEVRFAELSPLVFRLLELLHGGTATGHGCLCTLAQEAGLGPDALLAEGRAMLERLHAEGTLLGVRPG
ncbi:HvfC family RiPP maturation protein [Luteimonas kalidii]|uniref:DNA-binding domain-containing protein n=1 Tax=Luteimonas kalidii TaxID=3042025 RepID=A0ABT6JQB8_9GAMM|nr:putative DNA-binding domain-containing protein [Luteimonas kalidii]MDH5832884.1 putative DNA-binding domain-containing protein [Luteimonas kalidii]